MRTRRYGKRGGSLAGLDLLGDSDSDSDSTDTPLGNPNARQASSTGGPRTDLSRLQPVTNLPPINQITPVTINLDPEIEHQISSHHNSHYTVSTLVQHARDRLVAETSTTDIKILKTIGASQAALVREIEKKYIIEQAPTAWLYNAIYYALKYGLMFGGYYFGGGIVYIIPFTLVYFKTMMEQLKWEGPKTIVKFAEASLIFCLKSGLSLGMMVGGDVLQTMKNAGHALWDTITMKNYQGAPRRTAAKYAAISTPGTAEYNKDYHKHVTHNTRQAAEYIKSSGHIYGNEVQILVKTILYAAKKAGKNELDVMTKQLKKVYEHYDAETGKKVKRLLCLSMGCST